MMRTSSPTDRHLSPARLVLIAGLCIGLAAPALRAQGDEPLDEPLSAEAALYLAAFEDDEAMMLDDPAVQPDAANIPAAPAAQPATVPPAAKFDRRGRRIQADDTTVLAFKNVSLEQIVPFIVEATGKVVQAQPDVMSRRITLLNDQQINRNRALDMLFLAMFQNSIAVVETHDTIQLRDIGEIDRMDVPVIGPDESLLNRTDLGVIVEKIFALRYASAANIQDMSKAFLPTFAKISVDVDSNQIVIMANVGLLQRFEQKIAALDQPAAASLATETFHLRYADATSVAQNIRDLFAQTGNAQNNQQNPFANIFRQQGAGGAGNQGGRNQGGGGQGGRNQGGQNGQSSAATSANLRVTANIQQNSVTVLAEKQILEQVRDAISQSWDRDPGETAVPRVYVLKYTDPVKLKAYLTTLYGNPGGGTTGGGQAQAANQDRGVNRLYGQFSFEAIPEGGKLVVVAKNGANLTDIDRIVADIDQPQTVGVPQIVELKHADAEELAEQLNALLAQEGTLAQINRAETGLSQGGDTGASPFAQTTTATTTQQNQQTAANVMRFWWQQGRPPTTTSGSSNLVSKLRIVPVWRQNSLMVLSPPEYQHSIVGLIEALDKPGRQVLLSAVIAEINVDDATALGIRWSSTTINPSNQNNTISFGANTAGQQAGGVITGTKNDLLPGLFDTSVLNLGVNLNVLLQALNEKTAVSILSEPRIFTSDNQEAEFFSGQDVPFITESQPNDNGNLLQSFDYRAVGISLRVRPRITVKQDVDLRINLELSNIQPNQTLFGGFIVDRRETTTHIIVKDGQTVVLSGIMRVEDSDIKRKVPVLGDIPLVGEWLFTSTEKSKSKTELIAFVTPYVINNTTQTDDATSNDRARLKILQEKLRPVDDMVKDLAPKGSKLPTEPRQPAPNLPPDQPAPAPADPSQTRANDPE